MSGRKTEWHPVTAVVTEVSYIEGTVRNTLWVKCHVTEKREARTVRLRGRLLSSVCVDSRKALAV